MRAQVVLVSVLAFSQLLYYYHMRGFATRAPPTAARDHHLLNAAPPPLAAGAVNESATGARAPRKLVLCFPYSGEYAMVKRRLAQSPGALLVVSESLYGHNGLRKQNFSWPAHFAGRAAEYVQHQGNLYDTASARGRWAQEVSIRSVLGRGVRALYERGEIGDNDIVVVTDADEVLAPEGLAWLQAHLRHNETAVAEFRWFLFTHCYEHRHATTVQVAVTLQTLRVTYRWDTHRVRRVHGSLPVVHIPAPERGWHCSWCFGNRAIRDKMRLNIEPSSWASRGPSYVYADAELDRMRAAGTWFDGTAHGAPRCSPRELAAEIAQYARE
jgi:hypothetical protein